ncbi:S1/P1 nuclease [Paucibacter sp. APW11]|uniref:S1/P1 nuclease n=1 Tax=Roseateles aquae TaxID=3077235 RepID=A0ABU3PG43_9BURK|nr:S1/P1 nuclease [Paucibacter sp. APW11]MDT9001575.1 S1/P1 nuclease [Paucibacter sp. APW11]
MSYPTSQVTFALAAFLSITSGSAHAFGAVGHSAIGDAAAALIKGSRAEQQVQRILGSVSLHDIAVWADCVKGIDPASEFKYTVTGRYPECAVFENNPDEEARMRDYVQRNHEACAPKPGEESCHKQYHYTNPALQRGRYVQGALGTSEHDLVGAIGAAVTVLKGGKAPAPFNLANEREALALLVHIVGDVHQPLHVGSVYLDEAGHAIDPEDGVDRGPTHTVGGNALTLPASNLHAYWDNAPGKLSAEDLAALPAAARKIAASSGDVSQWPAQWASESLQLAGQALQGVTFGLRQQSLRGPRWAAELPADYEPRALAITRQQLARGGARLAALLKAIWP